MQMKGLGAKAAAAMRSPYNKGAKSTLAKKMHKLGGKIQGRMGKG